MNRTPSLTALLILAVLALTPASALAAKHARHARACAAASALPSASTLPQARATTLCLLNNQRIRRGMRPLRENARLDAAADAHARDMVKRDYFSHDTPTGVSFVDRILGHHYVGAKQAWSVGENLAWGQGSLASPASTMSAWMHSPGHRANILRRSFREIGIGIAIGDPDGSGMRAATYTTDFGRRS